jgi:peptidoglycan/xylan/chitin deacetylase (PgdA/CDA1 family)
MRPGLRKIYGKVYRKSPRALKSLMARSLFQLSGKPFTGSSDVLPSLRFPHGFKGGLIISADFELGWAFRYSKAEPYPEAKARQSRDNFPFLLKLFEDHGVPVTWATVGHLLLKGCRKGDHDWMRPIPHFENAFWSFRQGGWFDSDPCTSWEKAKEWYAPDLIEAILNSKARHEIGCHTFSHVDFSYAHCPRERAGDELKACIDAAEPWGIELESFVFPAGTYGNYEVLRENGIRSYRKALPYELDYPASDALGLMVMPSACGLDDNGLGWSAPYFVRRYRRYVDKAVKTRTLCHFWFHPSLDDWFLKSVFPGVIKHAAARREAGDLWIGTMRELSNHVTKIIQEAPSGEKP